MAYYYVLVSVVRFIIFCVILCFHKEYIRDLILCKLKMLYYDQAIFYENDIWVDSYFTVCNRSISSSKKGSNLLERRPCLKKIGYRKLHNLNSSLDFPNYALWVDSLYSKSVHIYWKMVLLHVKDCT